MLAHKTFIVPTDENEVVKCRSSIRDESKSSVKPLLEETFPSCNMWIKNTRTNTNARKKKLSFSSYRWILYKLQER